MRSFVISLGVALLAAASARAQAPADPKAAVSQLFDAIRTNDAATFAQVGPKVIIMVAPDFGVPMSFEQARKTFAGCSVVSLTDAKPLDGIPASIVSVTLGCGRPLPDGPIRLDAMADAKLVHGIYPGGIERFYPKRASKPPPAPGP